MRERNKHGISISQVCLVFVFLLFVLFNGRVRGESFAPGDSVAAKWSDGNYYLAKIEAISGCEYNILYADGDHGMIGVEGLRAIPKKPRWKVGDQVLAVWSTARFYPGKVKEIKDNGAVIEWDDGSTPNYVPFVKIMDYKDSGGPVSYSKGMTVAAKWSDGNYYLALIDSVYECMYDILYADGDRGRVDRSGLLEIPKSLDLKAGDKVMAVWSAARFYPGLITEITSEGVIVKWDDGSTTTTVPVDRVIKLP